jgi:hypothetical protein
VSGFSRTTDVVSGFSRTIGRVHRLWVYRPATPTPHAGKAHAARTLALPPRVGVIPATTIAACTASDGSHDIDRAARTRGVESLHSLSGLLRRRAPTASRSGRPTGDVIR